MANIPQADAEEIDTESLKVLHMRIPEDLHAELKGGAGYARQEYKDYVIETLRLGVEVQRKKGSRHARA